MNILFSIKTEIFILIKEINCTQKLLSLFFSFLSLNVNFVCRTNNRNLQKKLENFYKWKKEHLFKLNSHTFSINGKTTYIK